MSNTRENRKQKYFRENVPKYEAHIGHKVKTYAGEWLKLVRVSTDKGDIRVWLQRDGEQFPTPFWADEIRDCDCGKA